MARAITHCPRCGERVSPFAAGCAICGTDLEAARAAGSSRRRAALPRVELPRGRGELDWIHIAVASVVALAIPPVGLVLGLYWAVQRYRLGQMLMAAAMLAAAALAVAMFLDPMLFWNHLLKL